MSQLTTHILDTSIGKPAAAVQVKFEKLSEGVCNSFFYTTKSVCVCVCVCVLFSVGLLAQSLEDKKKALQEHIRDT
jgi:hypothetical protein